MRTKAGWPAAVGLPLALGGPALLVSPLHRLLGDPQALQTRLLDQLILWGLFAAIIAGVAFWERRPLGSIGWHGLRWSSVAWGLGLGAFYIGMLTPVETWLLRHFDLAGFDQGLNPLAGF